MAAIVIKAAQVNKLFQGPEAAIRSLEDLSYIAADSGDCGKDSICAISMYIVASQELVGTHGTRSEAVFGKVTDAAGTTKCKFKASLVGLIESLWVTDRPHGIVDVINSSSSHYGLQTARLWDSHGSSDNMSRFVNDLSDEQGPHDRYDMRERDRPSRYL